MRARSDRGICSAQSAGTRNCLLLHPPRKYSRKKKILAVSNTEGTEARRVVQRKCEKQSESTAFTAISILEIVYPLRRHSEACPRSGDPEEPCVSSSSPKGTLFVKMA